MSEVNFLDEISGFIFTSKYARYNTLVERRETWEECIDRVAAMHLSKFRKKLPKEDLDQIRWAFDMVKKKAVVPSMRSMQFGGKAVTTHNARVYNCAVRHIDSIRAFAEVFYLLLCGCGVGIGVMPHFIDRLPPLVDATNKTGTVLTYVVEDSIEGWADSIEALLNCYFKNTAYTGRKIVFDYSKIRPEGAPLKTSGGKAPGYKGLKNCHKKIKALLDHIIEDLDQANVRPINAYDILMHVSDAVLSGGIRRSATCVIFDINDQEMMDAKTYFKVSKHSKFAYDEDTKTYSGKVTVNKKVYEVELSEWEYTNQLLKESVVGWIHIEPQRARSNNSVLLLRDKVTREQFKAIVERTKQFGEPGFVFANHPWQMFNPCFEIGFIPVTEDGVCGVQFCNLSSVNGAAITTQADFLEATRAATIIGTLQASYTDEMKYLNNAAKKLTEQEALLGVSITGVMDNPDVLLNPEGQAEAAKHAVEVNDLWARKLGINPAARVTCIKPEGTSSLVLRSASGIHPHHARRYFRRVQCNKVDPVYKFFKATNPHMCEPSVWSANKTDDVITFPLTVSDKAMVKSDLNALKHLDIVRSTQQNWVLNGVNETHNNKPVSHNVSCTILVDEPEWDNVVNYLYDNREFFSAVSLLPLVGDKLYKQAPLEAVTTEADEALWTKLTSGYTPVDYRKLKEDEDTTKVQESLACAGGKCELY
ncbi:recombinase [Candidatus Dependentiae bacterium]|nr:MAG: recombinase [Candidatus Dependentiae bacterium]